MIYTFLFIGIALAIAFFLRPSQPAPTEDEATAHEERCDRCGQPHRHMTRFKYDELICDDCLARPVME